ncbi:cupin domain-containing protein [Halosimplex halophilum]|uniref:cupin domain-containing protein n=1 Tax=Halosimplex halophilum TaxID=2559572 RepID=UPI00107F4ACA|nr:cupin domain-containing protein [Halosimplex halophilum]
MGYHHVAVGEIEPAPDRPSVQRSVSDAAGLENVAVNRYEVEPGEAVPLAYHYHDQQEEVFYVLSGTLSVETPDETYEVAADEAFVVEPDSPQRAHVPESADERAVALVVGAPAVDDVHAYEESESGDEENESGNGGDDA